MHLPTLSAHLCGPSLPTLSGNIYCIGRNYADHVRELKNELPAEPVVFLKAPAALRPFAEGPLAFASEEFHHELEIVMLVGQALEPGTPATRSHIAAMSLGLDLTRRGVQDQLKAKGLPWTTAKSFSGSALLHPFRALATDVDLRAIDLRLTVEGELRQEGSSAQMMFTFEVILQFLASLHPLQPGDLIYTGTPAGVGPLRRGQRMQIESRALKIDARGVL